MTDVLGDLGLGAIVAILIIREFVSYSRSRRETPDQRAMCERVKGVADRTLVIHDRLEEVADDTRWLKEVYVRKSLEEAIVKLADNLDRQTTILEEFGRELRELRRTQQPGGPQVIAE